MPTAAGSGGGLSALFSALVSDPGWGIVLTVTVGLCAFVVAAVWGRRRPRDDD